MNEGNFNDKISVIIEEGFTKRGIQKLDDYANLQQTGKLLFKRFSPREQHGCTAGGSTHVIASLLAGAKITTDPGDENLSDFKRELKQAKFWDTKTQRHKVLFLRS